MKTSVVLREAAGKNLRGMTVGDAARFVRYAVADGALTPVDALRVKDALYAAEWLLATGRLAAAAHNAIKALAGARLASALDRVMDTAREATVQGYAEAWKAVAA